MSAGVISSSRKLHTNFGGIFSRGTNAQKVAASDALGTDYIRMSIVLLHDDESPDFDGSSASFDYFTSHGKKVLLNINNHSAHDMIHNFATDYVAYRARLNYVFDNCSPVEAALCENEILNNVYYGTDTIENFILCYKIFVDVCRLRGIQCGDGSMPWEWLLNVVDGIPDSHNADVITFLDAIATDPDFATVDFVNFHLRQPGMSIAEIVRCASYVRHKTGKKVISNEWSIAVDSGNTEPQNITLIQNTVAAWKKADIKYSILYDDDGTRGEPITDGLGVLTTLGETYRDEIA